MRLNNVYAEVVLPLPLSQSFHYAVPAASSDQVAIDSFGTTLFGKTGESLPYIRVAHERGLGEIDLSKIQIIERTV